MNGDLQGEVRWLDGHIALMCRGSDVVATGRFRQDQPRADELAKGHLRRAPALEKELAEELLGHQLRTYVGGPVRLAAREPKRILVRVDDDGWALRRVAIVASSPTANLMMGKLAVGGTYLCNATDRDVFISAAVFNREAIPVKERRAFRGEWVEALLRSEHPCEAVLNFVGDVR